MDKIKRSDICVIRVPETKKRGWSWSSILKSYQSSTNPKYNKCKEKHTYIHHSQSCENPKQKENLKRM